VSIFRKSGAMPLLSLIPSWRGQGQLHLFYRLLVYVPYWGILRELVFMFYSQNFLFVLLQYGLCLNLHIFCVIFQLLKSL